MSEFSIGQKVQLNGTDIEGIIRYIGATEFAPGSWIGVELETYDGKNDGSVKGERYFDCEMGRGMFLRSGGIAAASKPVLPPSKTTNGTAAKKPARPSSVTGPLGRRLSTAPDSTAKRQSLNAASPTPAGRPSRPPSTIGSPSKSPTKLMSAATSASSTPRTGTPLNGAVPPIAVHKPRPSIGGSRSSTMGPPAKPIPGPSRQSLTGASGALSRAPSTRATTARTALAPRPSIKSAGRIGSIGSQLGSGHGSEGSGPSGDEGRATPPTSKMSATKMSAKPASPVLSRTIAADRTRASPTPSRSTASPAAPRTAGMSTAATREIDDLKTKIRVMEKKAIENRDKLKGLDKVQGERDKFESIIQKLQSKYQPQQQEITELRKQLKEAETKFEEIENIQAEHDIQLEMATLDREMAEETAESLKTELEALKYKTEELELEVEVLREENAELTSEMSPEEKNSQGWLQLERNNERLRAALVRLRDMTQQTESELRSEIKNLEEDVREFETVKEHHGVAKEKLAQSEAAVEDLRQQLDNALGSEEMIQELTDKTMVMEEEMEELKAVIESLETLKEVSDELEINHVETEKELQEDIDFANNVITEQAKRAAQQEQAIADHEYTLSRFRELVTNLQSDLEDIRASQAMTETESEQLSSKSRAMMDLNMKLQVSAAKTQVKTIDLELRRLDAQEAAEQLAIVKLFLPESFNADKDSVLALLRFKRVAFKANLLHGFVKERFNAPHVIGHEDDLFASCDILDKLSWVSAMCERFINAISHCSVEDFANYEGALYELEPVERALNGWIDGLRRDELKEKQCASELQRTINLMTHLAEVHISTGLESYADEVHMRTVVMQSHLENAAAAMSAARMMVQTIIPSQGEEDELSQHFARKTDIVITQTRSAKVIIGKAVRALEDLKTRSLSLTPDTIQQFEQCETSTEELAKFSRYIGDDLFALLHEEGRSEPYNYIEVQTTVHRTTTKLFASSESDLFSTYLNKVRTLTTALVDLAALASDLEMTQEFERAPVPWVLRSQELKSSKIVPIDAEEEMRRLKDDNHERARMIAMKDQTLEEASVKIELLESRMRDATKKNERISELEKRIQEAKKHEAELAESLQSQTKELTTIEADRDKWRKVAEDTKALGVMAPGSKAGQERAVATAREMEALKAEIASLQAAVRFLREDNRRARLTEPSGLDWLSAPLIKSTTREEARKSLVLAEGKDVLNELLNLTTSSTSKLYDLSTMPQDRLAWRPAKSTPQYHVARQREDYEAWRTWKDSIVKKAKVLEVRDSKHMTARRANHGKLAAKVQLRLPDWDRTLGKGNGAEVKIVNPDDWEGFRERLGFV